MRTDIKNVNIESASESSNFEASSFEERDKKKPQLKTRPKAQTKRESSREKYQFKIQ